MSHDFDQFLVLTLLFPKMQDLKTTTLKSAPSKPLALIASADANPSAELPRLKDLSEQMTLADSRLFSECQLSDFFKVEFQKNSNSGLYKFIQHTNHVSRWIITRVLSQTNRKARGKCIAKLIRLIDVRLALILAYLSRI